MPTLLLTYATRPIAQRIAGLLKPTHDIIPATAEEVPSVLAHQYARIPHGKNPVYPHELLKLCLDKAVDLVIPLALAELQALQEAVILFEEYGITLLLPNLSNFDSFVTQCPPAAPLQVVKGGVSIIDGNQILDENEHGVYTLSENTWSPVII